MAEHDADSWYREFVATGSGRAFAAFFDVVAPELLRVAAALSRPGMDARDLVQQTLLVALEKGASFDDARPVLPWLCGILANSAHNERRRQRRRPDPDVLGGSKVSDPAAEVELDEAQQHAVRAIACVPQPHRGALELFLVHGLAPIEIARVLDRKRATVRSQIARGLDLLRKRLPASMAPGFALLPLAPGALADLRSELLQRLPGSAATASTLAITLSLAMKKYVVLFAGIALLSAFVVLATIAPLAPLAVPDASLDRVAAAHASLSAREADSVSNGDQAGAATRQAVPESDAATTGSLRVLVRSAAAATSTTAVSVFVSRLPANGGGPRMPSYEPPCSARTNATGLALFEGLAPGTWEVALDRSEGGQAMIVAGEVTTITINLSAGLHIIGRVVDDAQQPVAGAHIERWLSHRRGLLLVTTDSDGTFVISDLVPGSYLVARAAGYATSSRIALEGAAGITRRVTLQLARGASLSGVVRTPSGMPAQNVAVGVAPTVLGNVAQTEEGHYAYRADPEVVQTDEHGAFAFDCLPAGPVDVLVAAPHGEWGRCHTTAELSVHRPENLIIYLALPATIVGTVRDGEGRPCRGVRVTCAPATSIQGFGYGPFTHDVARTDSDGSYRLQGLGEGSRKLYAHAVSGAAPVAGAIELQAGNEYRWDPILEVDALTIRVLAPDQTALSGWMVRVGLDGHVNGERARTDERGIALLHQPRLGVTHVSVYQPSQADVAVPFSVAGQFVPEGASRVDIVVPGDALATATVTLPIVDAANQPVGDCEYVLQRTGAAFAREGIAGGDGVVRLQSLPPGEYRLLLKPNQYARAQTNVFVVRSGQQLELPTMRLAVGGRVAVRAFWPDAIPSEDVTVALYHPSSGMRIDGGPTAQGTWRSPLLAAGAWTLSLQGLGMRRTEQQVSLSGRDLDLLIQASEAPTVAITLRVQKYQAARWFRGRLQLVDQAGATAADVALAGELTPSQPLLVSVGLLAGTYDAQVTDERGHTWKQRVVVQPASSTAAGEAICMDLDG